MDVSTEQNNETNFIHNFTSISSVLKVSFKVLLLHKFISLFIAVLFISEIIEFLFDWLKTSMKF